MSNISGIKEKRKRETEKRNPFRFFIPFFPRSSLFLLPHMIPVLVLQYGTAEVEHFFFFPWSTMDGPAADHVRP